MSNHQNQKSSAPSYGQESMNDANKQESLKNDLSSASTGSDKVRNFSNPNQKRDQNSNSQNQNTQKSERTFDSIENKMDDLGENLKERGQYLSQQVTEQVQTNPWAFIGGASIVGLAVGYLLGRRVA